jgi:ABC-type branched-subunit amino acid transport system substrate-binding protein
MRIDPTGHERRQLLKALGATATFGLAGCTTTTTTDTATEEDESGGSDDDSSGDEETPTGLETVTIGNATNETGDYAYVWLPSDIVRKIAVEEVNEAGGPLGAEVELITRDTAYSAQQYKEVTTQLINSDDAAMITGWGSAPFAAHIDWMIDQKTPNFTGFAGDPVLATRGGHKGTDDLGDDEWIWRTVIGDSFAAKGVGAWVADNGVSKLGVLTGTTPTILGPTNQFKSGYTGNGGEVVTEIKLQAGQSDYSTKLGQMPWDEIDAFWHSFTKSDMIVFLRQWAESEGADTPGFLQEAGNNQDVINQMGDQLEGKDLITYGAEPEQSTAYERVKQKFDERNENEEWLPQFTPAAYDDVTIGMLALHKSGATGSIEEIREGIQRNVRAVSTPPGTTVTSFKEGKEALDNGDEINYEGATTNCNFTKHGNVLSPVGLFQLTPGGLETEEVIATDTLKGYVDDY